MDIKSKLEKLSNREAVFPTLIYPEGYSELCRKLKFTPLIEIDYSSCDLEEFSLNSIQYFIKFDTPVSDNLMRFGPFLLDLKEGTLYFEDRDYGPVPLIPYGAWSRFCFKGPLPLKAFLDNYFQSLLKQDFTNFVNLKVVESTGSIVYDSVSSFISNNTSGEPITRYLEDKSYEVPKRIWDASNLRYKRLKTDWDFYDRLLFLYSRVVIANEDTSFISVLRGVYTYTTDSLDFIQTSITNPKSLNSSENRRMVLSTMGPIVSQQGPSLSEQEIKAVVIEEIMEATGNLQYEPTKESLAKIGLDKYCTNRELSSFAKNHQTKLINDEGIYEVKRKGAHYTVDYEFASSKYKFMLMFDRLIKIAENHTK